MKVEPGTHDCIRVPLPPSLEKLVADFLTVTDAPFDGGAGVVGLEGALGCCAGVGGSYFAPSVVSLLVFVALIILIMQIILVSYLLTKVHQLLTKLCVDGRAGR